MKQLDKLKIFNQTHQMISQDLADVEKRLSLELVEKSEEYSLIEGFSQFEPQIKLQAKIMSEYYAIFYCLENSIRRLISDALNDAHPRRLVDKEDTHSGSDI